MPDPDTSRFAGSRGRRWLAAGAVVVFFLVLGALPFLADRRGTMPRLLYWAVDGPIVVFALSFHYEWSARRRHATRRTLLTSVALATSISTLCAALTVAIAHAFAMEVPPHVTPLQLVSFGAVGGLMQCGVWALAFVWPFAAEDARLKTLEAEKLKLEAEKLRAAAELAHLRSQLEPHFLMNSLNAIAGLVVQRPREARRLLGALGDLLRESLRDPDEMQSIADQVTWLRRYADILESRHSGVLRFEWGAIDDEARRMLVPRLLLQPLVENAVNHGALRRSGGGGEVKVHIAVEADEDARRWLRCVVEDNGPGLPKTAPRVGAIGIHSVERRLALKYEGARLELASNEAGTRAVVRLPCEAAA